MLETHYRASRFCRALGNPTAYQILKELTKSTKTPTQLAEEIGLSVKTISDTLRHLREVNLVRYTTKNRNKIYSLKDKLVSTALLNIEKYVERMRLTRR
jgi:predicted transcriptional regulator